MFINNYHLTLFEPRFAMHRILESTEEDPDDFRYLQEEVKNGFTEERCYSEGDTLHCRERDYHKYPARIAVVFEGPEAFMMQVFQDCKVGKLYTDILQQEEEIRPFFDCDPQDIIVLENHFGRELPRDLDRIVEYIQKIHVARKEYEHHRQFLDDWMEQYRHVIQEQNRYIEKEDPPMLKKVELCAIESFQTLCERIEAINRQAGLDTDQFFLPTSVEEQNALLFGLYYHCLKKELARNITLRSSNHFRKMLLEMHQFLQDHPTIIDDYCAYMDYPPFECATVRALVENEGLLRPRWVCAADDIL